ncbi:MAG: CbtB-domain containing protein [Rhodospirillales bacterium]|nr:CbtB-domain containing protein [Rhodospirillales bacterium]
MFGSLTFTGDRQSVSARVAAATLLIMIGTALLYGAGFWGSEILHNAAHDTRHALSFPCH